MSVLFKSLQLSNRLRYLKKSYRNVNQQLSPFCTAIEHPRPRNLMKVSLISAIVGAAVGIGYTVRQIDIRRKNIALEGTEAEITKLKYKPDVLPSRQVVSPEDNTGLRLTLFQYQTCPFCCKVRVMLDYYGINYDIVEVDPVLRREISWSNYKKVPILLAKVADGYQPLNDSTMIVSVLGSYLHDKSQNIDELASFYPSIAMHDDNGQFKYEIMNKYFLMYKNNIPAGRSLNDIVEERKWRKWADDVLVHMLSPNVYRTLDEAYDTFNWFSKVGKWEEYFPLWERAIIINVGAIAMWLISKRLKKRHHLKEDVRQSLYDEVKHWMRQVQARGGLFMGGKNPDLSDLAVYGVLKSIEGCRAFTDVMNNTNLNVWYSAMKERVDTHAGRSELQT